MDPQHNHTTYHWSKGTQAYLSEPLQSDEAHVSPCAEREVVW